MRHMQHSICAVRVDRACAFEAMELCQFEGNETALKLDDTVSGR